MIRKKSESIVFRLNRSYNSIMSIALALLIALKAPTSLKVGNNFYVKGSAVRLGRFLTSTEFSRDGQTVLFIDEDVEGSYAAERTRAGKVPGAWKKSLVRFDLRRGTKEILYTPTENETLMQIETVGQGGDVICTIAVGTSKGDVINWKAIFAPVGGQTRVIANGVPARSFQVAASKSEPKAAVLICLPNEGSRYLFITKNQTSSFDIPAKGYQGGFGFLRSKNGNPVAGVQGGPPDYKILGLFEISFASGQLVPFSGYNENTIEEDSLAVVENDVPVRSKGDPALNQTPLCDIFTRPKKAKPIEGTLFAQGVIAIVSESPTGLAMVFLNDDGFYLKEWIKADDALAKELAKKSG